MSLGMVSLIGAGCGRWDLITLRGLELLKNCGAVVYDDLIDRRLLDFAPAGARRISVGKREGRPSPRQEEINGLLIALAREGLAVARLKGGDPFVFGRGGEELLALRAAGVPCQEVPGITSAVAIPAQAGIPVTHRGVSQSFHVVTAHTAAGGLPEGLPELARLPGTLVFLMGLSRLEELTAALTAAGKDPAVPAAVVSGGCAPRPLAVRAPLDQIARAARAAGAEPPAVLLVGETAALDLTAGPLSGVRVGLVGTPSFTGRLAALLEGLGARVSLPLTLEVEELAPALAPLWAGKPGWLVLTSPNGAEALLHRLAAERRDLRALAPFSLAAIGPATGSVLSGRGLYPDLCPAEYTSAGLAQALLERAGPGERAVLLRSARGTEELPRLLRAGGLAAEELPLYTVKPVPGPLPELDVLLFGSAGGAEAFARAFGGFPPGVRLGAIGPVTARALERLGGRADFTARVPAADALVQGLLEALALDRGAGDLVH